jgi:hypothetical protein
VDPGYQPPLVSRTLRGLAVVLVLPLALCACSDDTVGPSDDGDGLSPGVSFTDLVITDVTVGTDGESLVIDGYNLGRYSNSPRVELDASPLVIRTKTPELIVAEAPGLSELRGRHLVTVEAGADLQSFDSHAFTITPLPPGTSFDQLVARDATISHSLSEDETVITLRGYNFDESRGPPAVELGEDEFQVENYELLSLSSLGTLLVATMAGTPSLVDEVLLVTVRGGDTRDVYDAITIRLEHVSPPETADCRFGICWETGPVYDGIWSSYPLIPYYYELSQEYRLDLTTFTNSSERRIPTEAARQGRTHQDYYDLMRQLPTVPIDRHTDEGIKWDFVSIVPDDDDYPTLIMRKGYRWDGASRPGAVTPIENIRSSLVHDALYDLIRFGSLQWETTISMASLDNRELADMLFFWINIEDEKHVAATTDPDAAYWTLRLGGWDKASVHPEYEASWRFRTLAVASVSSGGDTTSTDPLTGRKSVNFDCPAPDQLVVFDGSGSRPVPPSPRPGQIFNPPDSGLTGYADLHETAFSWKLFPPIGSGRDRLELSRDQSFSTTVAALTDVLSSGETGLIGLTVDEGVIRRPLGDDGEDLDFEHFDGVQIIINIDGCSLP